MASYVTVEEATTYFASRLHAEAWTQASTCDKGKALDMATRAIDRTPLKGVKASYDQANQFPRYPDAEVPQAVKEACCEEALAILEIGNSQRRKLQQEGVQSFSLGNMSETFAAGAGKGLLSQEAKELLRPWLLGAVNII
jgi:hypothetical protein